MNSFNLNSFNINRDYLKALSNLMPNGILTVNCEGKVIVINRVFTEILNMPEEKVVGQDIRQIVPKCRLCNVMESGIPLTSVYKINGRVYMAEYYPLMGSDTLVGGVAIFSDITKTKSIEDDLNETTSYKKMLESILQTAYEGVVIVDKDSKIIMINDSFANFIETEPCKVKGCHISDVIKNTRMPQVMMSGVAEYGHLEIIGSHRAVVSTVPIILNNNVIAGVETIWFKDIEDMQTLYQRLNNLKKQLNYFKKELFKNKLTNYYNLDSIIGESQVIHNLKDLITRASKSISTILILGESGTGKELIAHAIHDLSERRKKNLIKINCAAIPDSILESELFGYAPGAFTGAQKGGKPGKFEMADKGTLFLDEIGDMPYHMQAKLLRFLQEKETERLGENMIRTVDVRVIAATNQDLHKKIKEGKFREDLFYRLNVMTIEAPPLRNHKKDIPLIVESFIERCNIISGRYIKGVATEVMEIFLEYDWPGNVRQLENVVESAYNMSDTNIIELDNVPINFLREYNERKNQKDFTLLEHREDINKDNINKEIINNFKIANNEDIYRKPTENSNFNKNEINTQVPLIEVRDALEKKTINDILLFVKGNKSDAAKRLGITRASLYKKLKKYNL